ncbi:hypothetical protein OJF2_59870 [Aquisphaera giovannonii]|uniref:DUF1573 domain-containing protein n=1 Tax=Aquisphaera giovannonii TaxID=406548 RepID=A0A5B9WA38_9BACT|nr:DUF1573 domain-containing protein [Aquisphaera giovannonii]QEH37396.1 hypothetical protein OJF2_59870 [Aquisphaera giovannonii]
MNVRRTFRALGGLFVIACAAGNAAAAGWADSLFQERTHDFGAVPRGAKVKHDFMLVNRLAEPITILSLRPSCGCTSGKASAGTVNPGQAAVIEAQMDTRNFLGLKATTLFVTLVTASGKEAEVRLGVSSNILADIVLNPGSADFGTVLKGQAPSQVITIDRIGGASWRFERMVSASRVLTAKLVETKRDAGGSVSYALTVGIRPDAPAGPVRDEIRLISNDRETPSIPVLVTGYVRGDLTAAPSVLTMGEVSSAAGKQGRFVVRSTRPFSITKVEGAGDGFSVAAAEADRKNTHVITVAYRPGEGNMRGDLKRVFRVHTDLPDEPPLDLTATLHVNP